jgi:hypothetical protein
MFLSKICFILLALAAAIAVTFAVIAPRPFERRMGTPGRAAPGSRAVRGRADVQGRRPQVDRPRRQAGRDAIIAESLDAASRGSGEYRSFTGPSRIASGR